MCGQPMRETDVVVEARPPWTESLLRTARSFGRSVWLVVVVCWWLLVWYVLLNDLTDLSTGVSGMLTIAVMFVVVAPGLWWEPLSIIRGQSADTKKQLTLLLAAWLAFSYVSAAILEQDGGAGGTPTLVSSDGAGRVPVSLRSSVSVKT